MIKELISRFWAGGSSSGDLPYFGSDMLNRSGFVAKQNPEGLASVQRSVQILSDSCCSTSIGLMRSLPSGGYEAITNSTMARALNRLKYRDLDLAITSALMSGNGFLRVIRQADSISFKAIPSHRVSVAIDGAGEHWYVVAKDSNLHQPEIILSSQEMIHIRPKIDRVNPLMGLSPLAQIHASLPAICDAHFLMGALSKNLATPGLILATENQLPKEAVTRLRDIAEQQSAQYKSGGTLILSGGLKPMASMVSQSIKDADLINALTFSTIEVSRVFGVPPTLLGDTDSTSYNSATELFRSFQRSTVKPLMARIADAFTEALLSDQEIDEGLEIAFDAADFGAGKELADTLSAMVNSGIYSVNEARNALGKPDIDGGEIARCPANTMPMESWRTYYEQQQNQTPGNL